MLCEHFSFAFCSLIRTFGYRRRYFRSEKLKDSELARLNTYYYIKMSEEIWLFARLFVPLQRKKIVK